jgi:hypothetical protein
MNLLLKIAILTLVSLAAPIGGVAAQPTAAEQAKEMLSQPAKGGLSDREIRQIAALGPEILPVLTDCLQHPFGDRPLAALKVLGAMRDPRALPVLRAYVSNESSGQPILGLRTMLEIRNDQEMRDYVVNTLNTRMLPGESSRRYHYYVEDGFVEYLVDAPFPEETIYEIATRTKLADCKCRQGVFQRLVRRADDVSIRILQFYAELGLPTKGEISLAVQSTLERSREKLAGFEQATKPPDRTQKVWTADAWSRFRNESMAELKRVISRLNKELGEVGGGKP